ncbi:MAG TPA: ABC transporter permease [Solirubrobacteraceae bacterium]|nr:ABC transporter permease [Solirubrobacteraceae bacterium]
MSDPSGLTAVGGGTGETGGPVPAPSGTGPQLGGRFQSAALLRELAEQLGRLRLGRFSGVYLWALFVLVFALWIPSTFLSVTTAQTIASQEAIFLILALGVSVSMSAGQFDLSIGNNMGLGAAICILLLTSGHFAPVPAVAIAILVCVMAGAVNALLVVVVGIDSFIATLGMSSVLLALTEWATNSQYVGPTKASFSAFVTWQPLGVPILAVYALVVAILVWYGLEHTPMGRRIYATGANPDTARLSGIPVRRYIAGSLIFTGLIAGVAAVLVASDLGTVDYSIGQGYLLPTFAACFLSTTQVKPGRFNVWGVVVSLTLLTTGEKGLILAGAPTWITDMFDGVALLAAVGLAVVFRRRTAARSAKPPA